MKRLVVYMSILLALPATASAWYVNAKTSTTGQGTISPAGTQSYAAGVNSTGYQITPALGYKVSRVTLDGAPIAPTAGVYVAPYSAGLSWRYIVAYFAANSVNITTQVTGNGAIREDNYEPLTNIPVGSARQILVIPSPGYEISSVAAANATSVTTNTDGSRTVVYQNLQSNQTVAATFALVPMVTVSAGNNISTVGNGPDYASTIFGSATSNQGSISYAWSGTGLTFGTPSAATTTVYSNTPGTYTATLTATSGSVVKSASVTVTVPNRNDYLAGLCTSCHSSNTPAVVTAYGTSKHNHNVSCQACHTSDSAHVALDTQAMATACEGCHNATLSQTTHPAELTASKCISCHDGHNPAQGIAQLTPTNHPAVTLYTFEEIGMQMAGGQKVPVQVDANGKGMPYSPKQSCGTSGCHVIGGVDYTYDKISDHAFHSNEGRAEYVDSATGKFDATKNKPWLQSTAMVGKW